MHHLGCLAAIVIGAWLAQEAGAVPLVMEDLRCENLKDPLGVDVGQPRLSWKIAESSQESGVRSQKAEVRGQRQTAYQILVSSTEDLLKKDKGDLWDSGKVSSEQSIQVAYAGKALLSGQRCFWKVRAWTSPAAQSSVFGGNKPTAWSAPAQWTMGVLKPEEWTGKWLGMASAKDNDCIWYRKTFSLTTVPEHAEACVSSLGFHELFVNGRKVGDQVLTPSVSDLQKRALYVAYDLKPYLKPGKNAVVIWVSPGWSLFRDANPVVDFKVDKKSLCIAQLYMGDPAKPSATVMTDESWRCALSHVTHLGKWQNGDFGGDRVDMIKEKAGWSDADFDDGGWEPATVYQPGRALSADLLEPNRKCDTIAAVRMNQVSPGKYRFAVAKLFTGWVEVKLKGKPGAKVTIKVSSLPDHELEYNELNEYIIGPTGQGTFCNRFSYHECGFVTVEGLDYEPALTDVVGYRVTNDRKRVGDFDCSNQLLKRIYDITVNNYVNLSTGGMTVDCPHRERLGYGGDGHTSLEIALDTFESDAFFAKWAQDWCDIQEADGRSYHTAPTMGGGGGPAWSGFVITMPWEVYLTYGDKRILEKTFPSARKWLGYLDAHVGGDGVLAPLPGGYWLFLGDWLTPHGSEGSELPEALLFNNCYYLYVTRLAAKIAQVLGKPDDERELTVRAEKLQQAIHKRFFNPATNAYLDTRQTHLVMPLISGAVPPEQVGAVMKNLAQEILVTRQGHLDTGLHGTYFMTKYLTEHDRSDLVFTYATQTTFPSYGDLIAKGYETWPESWDGNASRMHGCMNGIGGWFHRGLAGIRHDPDGPGFKRFIIKPQPVGDLTWVKAGFDSAHGRIVSNWQRDGNKLIMEITVPINTSAMIYVPVADGKSVSESGKPAAQAPGVKFVRNEGGAAVFEVGSGTYRFVSEMK